MTLPLHDPAWLERMYNNRALVPDHMDYLQRWARDSAQVRANVPCVLDVAYGSGAGETLDVFPSARTTGGPVPVLVFIHGGYWRSLDKSDHSFIAPPFTQAGFCVVVVNYALCPGTPEAPVTIPQTGGPHYTPGTARREAGAARMPADAPADQIAISVYDIRIRPGIRYAPHPAFAKDAQGRHLYHALKPGELGERRSPLDFAVPGTRELVADDYVYAMKRHATPRIVFF